MIGKVYVNWGRVIVDCPYGCGNSYKYERRMTTRKCNGPGGCQYDFPVEAPENLSEIVAELNKRPLEKNRNWYPEGHPTAVRSKAPMGQSVADLAAEFELETA